MTTMTRISNCIAVSYLLDQPVSESVIATAIDPKHAFDKLCRVLDKTKDINNNFIGSKDNLASLQ